MSPVSELSFKSGAPPQRIMGTETEYDIRLPSGDYDPGWYNEIVDDAVFATIGLTAARSSLAKEAWLSNGARMYSDGGHLEYATPESLGAREAVLTSHAGNLVISRVIEAADQQYLVFRRGATVDPRDGTIFTKGYHQNLCIPDYLATSPVELLQTLESHLMTQLYAWGGVATREGYNICPKATHIRYGILHEDAPTDGGKVLARVYRDGFGFGRFEDRSKTPSSAWSEFMGMATTSLLLRVLEHPYILHAENKLMKGLRFQNNDESFTAISHDLDMKRTYPLANGKSYRAIDIQAQYAEIAEMTAALLELPQEEVHVAQEWTRINDDIRQVINGEQELSSIDRIGWVKKYNHLVSEVDKTAVAGGSIAALTRCLFWDRIHPRGKGQRAEAESADFGLTSKILEPRITTPPSGTRARARSAYISRTSQYEDIDATWGGMHILLTGEKEYRTVTMHPYAPEHIPAKELPVLGY